MTKVKKPRVDLVGLSLTVAVTPLLLGAMPAYAQGNPGEEAQQAQVDEQGQVDSQEQGEEIIVTAQRREQALIDVPAAITALGGENIQELNLGNIASVATHVPNVSFRTTRGGNTTPSFTIRGLRGDELAINESSIAVYTDDAYLGDVTLLGGSIFDLERVEVLRGPQGTLFGRNTTGGLMHFISAKPTRDFSGYGSILYGADNEIAVEGAVSGPITEGVRARLAGRFHRHDGHFRNDFDLAGTDGIERKIGDRKVWSVRGIVDIDVTDNTLLRLIGGYAENNSQSTPGLTLGTIKPGELAPTGIGGRWARSQTCSLDDILAARCLSIVQIANGGAPVTERGARGITNLTPEELAIDARSYYATANLTHDFGWGKLTSITHYNNNRYSQKIDADGGATPTPFRDLDIVQEVGNRSRQFTQEVRLNGSTDAIDWVTGLYFYKDRKSTFTHLFVHPPVRPASGVRTETLASLAVKTQSEAIFAQIDAHLSDEVTLTAGGRYTHEKREATEAHVQILCLPNQLSCAPVLLQDIDAFREANNISNSTSVRTLTGRLALSWEPSSNQTYYVSYSRGTKSPGFSHGFSPSNSALINSNAMGPVGQETLDSFEVGAKWRLLDGKLTVNTAAFFYNFDGKQSTLTQWNPLTQTAFSNYINVGTAQMYGVEAEINFRPDRHWDFSFGGGLLHSEITKSDVLVLNTFGVPVALEGLPLDATPEWTFNFIGAYHQPLDSMGELTFQVEVTGAEELNFSIQNEPLANVGSDRVLANLRVMWESADERYNAQAFVTNVFDKTYAEFATDIVIGNQGKWNMREGEGRVWGVKFGLKF